MKCYTERISFTLPLEEKLQFIAEAKRLGIPLAELFRRATADISA